MPPKAKNTKDHSELLFVSCDASSIAKPVENARQLIRYEHYKDNSTLHSKKHATSTCELRLTNYEVRSHVMRGKNKKVRKQKLQSWINHESVKEARLDQKSVYLPSPTKLGSDLPFTRFACELPPYASELIFNFFAHVGQQMYPIELCLTFDLYNSKYVEYLALDALFCQSILWMSQAHQDFVNGRKYSRIQLYHANKALIVLHQRLNDPQLAVSDSTIGVVIGMVLVTALMGDVDAALNHMRGLHKMIGMRGGIRAFQDNPHVQVKMCRADLILALLTRRRPLLFTSNISWSPYIENLPGCESRASPLDLRELDPKLCHIWSDLQNFSRSANLSFQTGKKIDCILFQEILISIQYRLQLFDVHLSSSRDNAIHIGMLAYSANIFLRVSGIPGLVLQLQDTISALSLDSLELKLWLLFVACMYVTTEDDDAWIHNELTTTLSTIGLSSWSSVSDILKQHLWISQLHDASAKLAFASAMNVLSVTE